MIISLSKCRQYCLYFLGQSLRKICIMQMSVLLQLWRWDHAGRRHLRSSYKSAIEAGEEGGTGSPHLQVCLTHFIWVDHCCHWNLDFLVFLICLFFEFNLNFCLCVWLSNTPSSSIQIDYFINWRYKWVSDNCLYKICKSSYHLFCNRKIRNLFLISNI